MSQKNPSDKYPEPCQHLSGYRIKHGYTVFKALQKLLFTSPIGKTSIKKPGSEAIPRCSFCNEFKGRLYLCLICSSFSCLNHTLLHPELKTGHDLFVDIERAELYCGVCCDQVIDPDFDQLVMICNNSMILADSANESESIGRRLVKRRRLDSGSGFEFSDLQASLDGVVSDSIGGGEPSFPLGLRGLKNLGSTCFLNSVMQALLHAPPVRDYFLNGGHSLEACQKKKTNDLPCLLCHISATCSAVFSEDRKPYNPAGFLRSWWRHAEDFASYKEHDAHEFFIALLGAIHEKEGRTRNGCRGIGECQCIVHRVFGGLLRSDVTCMACGFTSTTYDPCLDISLNLNEGKVKKPMDQSEEENLRGLSFCLDLFTRPESLGSDQKLYCQKCQEKQESLKQMSIQKLPLVLCLHIKRFEHDFATKVSRKIDRYQAFPFSLDMAPYLSPSVLRARYGNRPFNFEVNDSDVSSKFKLFAVVTHSGGMLETGHYVTYLRVRKRWYKCDDEWIIEVDEDVVRASECYMLFYGQKALFNKEDEDPTHQPISPA